MSSGAHRKILVIEDDPDMQALMVFVLEDRGYEVTTAADGREGLTMAGRDKPDLIVLDMRMPVMDGWQFARTYRATSPDPAPILVMTAAEDPKERGREIGAAGSLGKPVDLDVLCATVEQLSIH